MQRRLEEGGEYVVRANRNWFAVFAGTWQERLLAARRQGREGPNLVVHRTESGDPRDHHVLPYALVKDLLVDETVTRSAVNGSVRWNLVLKDDTLRVSHRAGTIDVSAYRRDRLLVEPAQLSSPLELHVHEAAFAAKVERSLLDSVSTRRARIRRAAKRPVRQLVLAHVYVRNPDVVAEVLLRANGACEVCRKPAPFLRAKDGSPYLEVHHKVQLADNGEDTVENAIAACPNCHRRAHFGEAQPFADLRVVTPVTLA
jgi:HNH endonuclease